jgi:hypothetical protein
MAFAAFVAIVAVEPSAEVLTSFDGTAIELNKLVPSARFAGALAIWLHYSYVISVDCSPPRACYPKTQVTNYHFRCLPRFIVVTERISMDLNGNIVNHQAWEPTPVPDYEADDAVLNRFCGPPRDPPELPQRSPPPEPRDKPKKGN